MRHGKADRKHPKDVLCQLPKLLHVDQDLISQSNEPDRHPGKGQINCLEVEFEVTVHPRNESNGLEIPKTIFEFAKVRKIRVR
jgi:hypothetical protein